MNELLNRYERFLDELKVPRTRFASMVNLSTTALYRWAHGELRLSSESEKRIGNCLARYGF